MRRPSARMAAGAPLASRGSSADRRPITRVPGWSTSGSLAEIDHPRLRRPSLTELVIALLEEGPQTADPPRRRLVGWVRVVGLGVLSVQVLTGAGSGDLVMQAQAVMSWWVVEGRNLGWER
jgi:hypothetical protein